MAWLLLRGLRLLSRHLPRRAGPIIRQGIANLYRPGNHAGAAVMALGVGVMFTVTVWIVQRGLLQDIVRTAPPGMPNVYLLDITAANRDAVDNLLIRIPGVLAKPEMLGAVSAQIQSIDGVVIRSRKISADRAALFAHRYGVARGGQAGFTQVSGRPLVVGGRASGRPRTFGQRELRRRFSICMSVRLSSGPRRSAPFTSSVVAIHKSESVRLTARIEFFLTPQALDGLPAIYYGGLRAKPQSVPAIQKALYDRFPTDHGRQHGGCAGYDSVAWSIRSRWWCGSFRSSRFWRAR